MSNNKNLNEIIIAIVSPVGLDSPKNELISKLRKIFEDEGFKVELIKLTEKVFLKDKKKHKKYNPFLVFTKMELCWVFRKKICHAFMACIAVNEIRKCRKKIQSESNDESKKVIYIIDQLKHTAEYKVLRHVYGLSYVQLSLFSREDSRKDNLSEKFKKNDSETVLPESLENYINKITILDDSKNIDLQKDLKNIVRKSARIKDLIQDYKTQILRPDEASQDKFKNRAERFIKKDKTEIDEELSDAGQQGLGSILHSCN